MQTPEQALQHYSARRFDRCRDVVESSLAAGRLQMAGAGPGEIGGTLSAALHRLAAPF